MHIFKKHNKSIKELYTTKNKIQKVKLTLAIKPQVEEVNVKEKLCIFIRVRSRYQLL